MIRAYICHPYSNDPAGNVQKVMEICKEIALASVTHMKTELDVYDHVRTDEVFNIPYAQYSVGDGVVVPIAPHLLFPKFMSEDGGVSRDAALAFCLGLMYSCNEVWVCSQEVTEGMRLEIEYASAWGIRVVFHTF